MFTKIGILLDSIAELVEGCKCKEHDESSSLVTKLSKINSDINAINEYLVTVESGCLSLTPSKKQRIIESCENHKKELNEAAMHLLLGADGTVDADTSDEVITFWY